MINQTITMVLQRNPKNYSEIKEMRDTFTRSLGRKLGEFGEVSLKSIMNYGGHSGHSYFVFELTITDSKKYNIAKLKNSQSFLTVTKLHDHYLRVESKIAGRNYIDISPNL